MTQATSRPSFVDAMMTHLMGLAKIPKVQVERAVGPVLGMFISEVLSAKLDDRIELISPEFPLRKTESDTHQSTNIDWLLYSSKHDELVFCELKTTDTTFDEEQAGIYGTVIDTISSAGARFLLDDLRNIRGRSQEKGKYDEVLRRFGQNERYAACRRARLIYLGPEAMREAKSHLLDSSVTWMSFQDLPLDIDSPFREEWATIHRHLAPLDTNTRQIRNENSLREGDHNQNFKGRCSFEKAVELCRERQGDILIGFTGGTARLEAASLDDLRSRAAYKWDEAENTSGKYMPNWIRGNRFLEIVERMSESVKAAGA